jgi:hypothetical protein
MYTQRLEKPNVREAEHAVVITPIVDNQNVITFIRASENGIVDQTIEYIKKFIKNLKTIEEGYVDNSLRSCACMAQPNDNVGIGLLALEALREQGFTVYNIAPGTGSNGLTGLVYVLWKDRVY